MNSLSFLLLYFPNLKKILFGKCSNAPFNVEIKRRGGRYMCGLLIKIDKLYLSLIIYNKV